MTRAVDPSTPPMRCRRRGYDVQSLIPSDPLAEFRCPECGTAWTRARISKPPPTVMHVLWTPCILAGVPLVLGWILTGVFDAAPSISLYRDAQRLNAIAAPATGGLLATILAFVRLVRCDRCREPFERIPNASLIILGTGSGVLTTLVLYAFAISGGEPLVTMIYVLIPLALGIQRILPTRAK